MKNKENSPIINQVFGINSFEETYFCYLKNVYNSFFTAKNSAPCLGAQNMKCVIISLEGEGIVIRRDKVVVNIPPKTVFFGSMANIDVIKSNCDNWHFICYWYFMENFNMEFNGVYSDESLDFDKELKDANDLILLLQTRSKIKTSLASSLFTQKMFNFIDVFKFYTENNNKLLDKITAYISTHIKEKLTTKDIANEFGYCEKHIRYIFNKYLDTTPGKFIDGIKLEQIIMTLQNSPYSLNTIAEMYNYSSTSHLISNFKKKYGVTPKQYLKTLEARKKQVQIVKE